MYVYNLLLRELSDIPIPIPILIPISALMYSCVIFVPHISSLYIEWRDFISPIYPD